MYGFPPILDGNAGVKMTNNADTGFLRPGIREIFYSNRNGNWTDPGIWETASGRVGILPGPNDDVYVRHTIGGNFNAIVNNLIITLTGVLNGNNANSLPLVILNSLQSYGTFNYAPNSNGSFNNLIVLCGVNNYIDKTKQTPTCIHYGGPTSQPIIDANYRTLRWGSWASAATRLPLGIGDAAGEKYLTCDLTVGSIDLTNLGSSLPLWINFKNFNFTCNGNISAAGGTAGNFYCDGNGTLTFKGSSTPFPGGLVCSGSPTIEFQGDVFIGSGANILRWTLPYNQTHSYLGTGRVRFTTNNQAFRVDFANLTLDNTFEIADNITVNFNVSNAGSALTLTNTVNGLGANSRLVTGTNTTLNFATQLAAQNSMTTGIIDFTTNVNTVQFNGNYSANISPGLSTFRNLTIGGTGIKTLGANTTLNGNLSVSGILECSTFNLSVGGTTSLITNSTFSKNGAGNLIFTGQFTANFGQTANLDLSGNPTIEFKNGFAFLATSTTFNIGTGLITFSTNTQTFSTNKTFTIQDIVVSGNINVTINNGGSSSTVYTINGTINGTLLTSKFTSNARIIFNNSTLPMTTGIFDCTTLDNQVRYLFNGNFTIPYTSYQTLIVGGTGTKTLSGNTTMLGSLTINTGATLDLSIFDITVNSNTNNSGTLLKSSTGNLLFIGTLINTYPTSGVINFSGNPNVELRNGLTVGHNPVSTANFNSGTGTWTFTTNTQTVSSNQEVIFNCNFIISGITVVLGDYGTTPNYQLNGTINGTNSSSTLRVANPSLTVTCTYNNATQPMATGVLDTSTNLNTFIYGAGNQDVKGGTPQQYRNLRFSGTGTTKTLQGNINVQNTYTVDSGVTVNLNGFTKTP